MAEATKTIRIIIEGENLTGDDFSDVNKELDKLTDSASDAASKGFGNLSTAGIALGTTLGNLASGGIMLVVDGLVNMASSAAGAVTSIVTTAADIDQATNVMATSMGISKEAAAEFEGVMKGIFANNFGESFEDIGVSVTEVVKQLGNLPDAELQRVTEQALSLRDAFGVEVGESIGAVNTLMDKFGLTSQEAMDFVTSGFQQGLNSSDDFLDSITEYGTQFASGGGDAGQFFSIMETGLANGMLGTDKAADAFKEFRVRIQDGSTLTAESLAMIGLNAEDMAAQMADGSLTAVDAFGMVMGALQGVDDQNTLMQAGVGLLGTQFEDLGTQGALALDLTATKMSDLAGATDTLNTQYDNFGSMWEGIKRQALIALEPIGDALLDLANEVMPIVSDFMTNTLQPAMSDFGKTISELIGVIKEGGLSEGIKFIRDKFSESWPVIQEALLEWSNKFWDWLTGAGGVVSSVTPQVNSLIDTISGFLADQWPKISEKLTEWSNKFWDWVLGPGGAIERTSEALSNLLGKISAWASDSATQQKLTELGEGLGKALIDGLVLVLSNSENIVKAVTAIGGALLEATASLIGIFIEAGSNVAGGFIEGIIEKITGGEVTGETKDIIQKVMETIFDFVLPGKVFRDLFDLADTFEDIWKDIFKSTDKGTGKTEKVITSFIAGILKDWAKWLGDLLDELSGFIGDTLSKWAKWLDDLIKELVSGMSEMLREWISWLADMLSELISGITEMLNEWITWLADLLSELIASMADMLSEWIAWLADMLSELISGITEMLNEWIAWLADLLSELISGMSEMLSEWIAWLADMLSELVSGITDMLNEWIAWLVDMVNELISGVTDMLNEWISWLADMLSELISGITDMLNEWISWLADMLSELISGVTGMLSEWISWLTDMLSELISGIAGMLSEWISWLADMLSELISGAAGMLNEWIAFFADLLSELIAGAASNLSAWIDFFADLLIELVGGTDSMLGEWIEWFADLLTELIGGTGALLERWIQWLADMVTELISGMSGVAQEWAAQLGALITGFTTFVADFLVEVVDWLVAMGQTIIDNFFNVTDSLTEQLLGLVDLVAFGSTVYNELKAMGEDIINTINVGVTALETWFNDQVKAFLSSMVSSVLEDTEGWIKSVKSIGGKIIDSIKSGITNAWDSFIEWLWSQLSSIASSLPWSSSNSISNIGVSIVSSMIDGISSQSSKFQKALSSFVSTNIEQTFSPVPAAGYIGDSIVDSMINGLVRNGRMFQDALRSNVSSWIDSATTGLGADLSLNAGINGSPLTRNLSLTPPMNLAGIGGGGDSIIYNPVYQNTFNTPFDVAEFDFRVQESLRRIAGRSRR